MTIARLDLWDDACVEEFQNTTLNDHSLFNYGETTQNLTLFYGCLRDPDIESFKFICDLFPVTLARAAYYVHESFLADSQRLINSCFLSLAMPVHKAAISELFARNKTIQEALNEGFDVVYIHTDRNSCAICQSSGGICGSDSSSLQFRCFCRDQPHPLACEKSSPKFNPATLFLASGIAFAIVGLLVVGNILMTLSRKRSAKDQNVKEFIKQYAILAPRVYSYLEVKKMTNSFKEKLGQGGFSCVYKGKLADGRPVAVKVLNESKGHGEEFINEVASISKTSHVNIVSLLGYSFGDKQRALIYEFMPNGSLEKFINNGITSEVGYHLGWEKLYRIAVGIARGLEYLHRGCNTRILHFDIKPHNILLDENFCPKISDFGLARLCPNNESTISTMEARGTMGYIAPEVFSRNFGVVSYKSDVYSYGMMILEMVGARRNVEEGAGNSSDIYFPQWIYKRLELGQDLGLTGNMSEEENENTRRMLLVGLWCIQTNPSHRPSMSKVIEMLEGSTESLQIPPRPFASSSPPKLRLMYSSSTTSI